MKWGSWVVLAVVSSGIGACGDSPAPTDSAIEAIGSTQGSIKKGSPGAHVGDSDYCDDAQSLCGLGEGDCDTASQCQTGLVCVPGNLAKRGPFNGDACAPSHCGNGQEDVDETSIDCGGSCGSDCAVICDAPNGTAQKCSTDCPCSVGEGDCSSSSECQAGLVCGSNNGPLFQLPSGIDACWASTCQNGAKDGNETAVDCGGSCAPCTPPPAGPVAVSNGSAALLNIVIAPHADGALHGQVVEIANDLRDKLNAIVQASGSPFVVASPTNAPSGISLGIDGDFANTGWPYQGHFRPNELSPGGSLQPERLALREQYVLRTPQGSNRVIVAGATVDGLRHAVWDLLRRAGYRHYFQTDKWEVVPSIPSLSLNLAVDEKPAYFARNIVFSRQFVPWDAAEGTANTAEQAAWLKHNRMGGLTTVENTTVYGNIMAWYSQTKGIPFPAALTTSATGSNTSRQFCLTGAAVVAGQPVTAVDVVRQWAAAQTSATVLGVSPNLNQNWPSGPAGNGLHCNDINDPTFSSVSNRIAALANAAAEVQPNRVIVALVTTDATESPTLALRQNVLIKVEGDSNAFAADNRLSAWARVARDVGVSDYLGGRGTELPGDAAIAADRGRSRVASQANTKELVASANSYYRTGARQYTADMNYGWGLPGPSVWALSQSLWDADADPSGESYRTDFFIHAFGPAADSARNFYDTLENHPAWSESVIGQLYLALDKGFTDASQNERVLQRLGDLAVYTRYLELTRKFWNRCSTQSQTEQDELRDLLSFLYNTRDTRLLRSRDVAATVLGLLPSCPPPTPGLACAVPEWGVTCPSATAACGTCTSGATCNPTKQGSAPTLLQLRSLVSAGVANHNVLAPSLLRNFSTDLVPYLNTAQFPALPPRIPSIYTLGPNHLYLQRPASQGGLSVHVRKYAAANLLLGKFSLHPSNTLVSLEHLEGGTLETDWTLPTATNTVHRLDLDDQLGRLYTTLPQGTRLAIPVGIDAPPLALNYRWSAYFFVPAGTQNVVGWTEADGKIIRHRKTGPSTWETTTSYLSDYAVGHTCSPRVIGVSPTEALNDHFVVPVNPPATTDELWLFDEGSAGTVGSRLLLSTPAYLIRSPGELLVPREVAPEVTNPTSCSTSAPCPEGQYCGSAGTCLTETDACTGGSCPACPAGGDCPTHNPDCSLSNACPSGMVCPTESNGWRFGEPGKFICEPIGCCDSPDDVGKQTPECGLCVCKPDCASKQCGDTDLSDGCNGTCLGVCEPGETGCQKDADCTAGNICRGGTCVSGPICGQPDIAPPTCGPGTACGPCPTPPAGSNCDNRQCGTDPMSGANCGACGAGQFCNGAGHCGQLDTTPPIEVPTASGGTRTVTPPASPSAPALFGGTQGSFAVTDRGSASYTVPIEAPPGRAGIEPALSIRYTSSTGNGALGVGWSLDGFSSIARCPNSYAQDGAAKPIKGDATDAFCLDGQRLVLVGTNEYRTQIESFSKIVALNVTSNGPQSFEVYTKDGRILSFGSTKSARSVLRGTVVGSWHLDRVRDRSGNFMRIAYEQTSMNTPDGLTSTAEIVPKAVTYTGFGTTDGDREVLFNYDNNRVDRIIGFRPGGGTFARLRMLRNIEVRAGNERVRRYTLAYETSNNNAQRLITLQECAGAAAAACRNPTTFTYRDEQGFEPGQDKPIPPEYGTSLAPRLYPTGIVHKSDDGRDLLTTMIRDQGSYVVAPIPPGASELASFIPAVGPYISAGINLVNAFGAEEVDDSIYKSFTFDMMNSTSLLATWGCDNGRKSPTREVIGNGNFGAQTLRNRCPISRTVYAGFPPAQIDYTPREWLIDLDADGVQDTLYCAEDPGQLVGFGPMHLDYRLAKAATTSYPQPPLAGQHSDRDGEVALWGDICNPLKTQQFSRALDIDNDGTSNLLAYDPTLGWAALMPTASGFEWQTAPASGIDMNPIDQYYVVFIDANGDGLRDLLGMPFQATAPNPVIAYNKGNGFVTQSLTPFLDGIPSNQGAKHPDIGAYVVDIDQDGIEELVYPDPNAKEYFPGDNGLDFVILARPWRVGRVKATQYFNESLPSLVGGAGVLGDFDGDGDIDAFTRAHVWIPPYAGSYNLEQFKFHSGLARRQNLLSFVKEGAGRWFRVEYENTNQLGQVYDKFLGSGTCAWPQRCVARPPHALVSAHTEMHLTATAPAPSGLSLDRVHFYQYKGARLDIAGYGWLGFNRRIELVEDGESVKLARTTTGYNDPEPWVVGTSTAPYTYLKAGLPKSTLEEGTSVSASEISGSQERQTTIVRTLDYTTATSSAGRPFIYLSSATTSNSDVLGLSTPVSMTDEVGTTVLDQYGNITDQSTTRRDYKFEFGVSSVAPNSTTIERTVTDYTPTQSEINNWLISLPKTFTTESTPRCFSTQDCANKKRTRVRQVQYYPTTGLPRLVLRPSTDPELEAATELFRDQYGNVTKVVATDTLGNVRESRATYDPRGLFPITRSTFGDGKLLTSQVRFDNRFGGVVAQADPNGIDSTFSYDEFGISRRFTGPGGSGGLDYQMSVPFETPDGFEVLSSVRATAFRTGGEQSVTDLNNLGQVVSRRTTGYKGAEVFEEFGYDYRQRLLVARRPHLAGDTSQGHVLYAYDEIDRVVSQDFPDGTQVRFDYANSSSLATAISPWNILGARTFVQTTDQRNNKSLAAYDRDGQPVVVVDASGNPTTYDYAAFGTLKRIVDPLERMIVFEHDAYGRLKSVDDEARGGIESTSYNGLDEVIATLDAANRSQLIHRDDFGRPESVDDADGTSTYIYDGSGDNELGRLVEVTSAFGQTQTFGFEPRGQTSNRGFPNRATSFLVAPQAAPGTPVRELTTEYHFDSASRLEQVDYPVVAGTPLSVKYEFDAYGHTIKASNAASPSQIYWQLVSAYQGHRVAEERQGTHPCGTGQGSLTTRSYEALTGRVQSIQTTCGSQVLLGLTYGYDDAGNMTSRGDASTSLTEVHGYDALNRLITYSPGAGVPPTTRYRYDELGVGRLDWQANVGDYVYSVDGRDWIESAGSTSYGHDLVGNITSRVGPGVPGGSQQIQYSAADLPTSIISPGSETNFAYDAQGRRVVKEAPNATTYYAGDAYQATDTGTAVDQRFMVYVGGRAVAQLTNSVQGTTATSMTTRYLHDDVLGSVRVVSNTSGSVASARSYQPFGQSSPPGETPFGFTGHEGDDDLGLINMKGRMYDPSLAQFLSADPIISQPYGQGLNRFAYVNNSPLNFTDPSGFSPEDEDEDESGYYIAGRGGSGAGMWIVGGAVVTGAVIGGLAPRSAGGAVGGAVAAATTKAAPGATSTVAPAAANAVGSFATSVFFNQSLFSSTSRTSQQAEGYPAGGGQTGAAPGRGAVAPDAVAPVQETTITTPQTRPVGGYAPPGAAPNAGASPQAPFVKDGRVTDAGRNILRRTFDRYNFDVNQIRVTFKHNLGQDGITLGNRILLDARFQYLSPYRQMRLLAHEITHSVQYRDLGNGNFLERYAVGYKQVDNYDIPSELWAVPTNKLSVTQAGSYLGRDGLRYNFTLDQIAERIGIETASALPYQ